MFFPSHHKPTAKLDESDHRPGRPPYPSTSKPPRPRPLPLPPVAAPPPLAPLFPLPHSCSSLLCITTHHRTRACPIHQIPDLAGRPPRPLPPSACYHPSPPFPLSLPPFLTPVLPSSTHKPTVEPKSAQCTRSLTACNPSLQLPTTSNPFSLYPIVDFASDRPTHQIAGNLPCKHQPPSFTVNCRPRNPAPDPTRSSAAPFSPSTRIPLQNHLTSRFPSLDSLSQSPDKATHLPTLHLLPPAPLFANY
ncbi:hypothetical protein NMG60_11007469 [Bertholletia excelsa]